MSQDTKPLFSNWSDANYEIPDEELHLLAKLAGDQVRKETRQLEEAGLRPPKVKASTPAEVAIEEDALAR